MKLSSIISESIILFTAWIQPWSKYESTVSSSGRVRVLVNNELREYEVSARRFDYLRRLSPTKALEEIEKVNPDYKVIERLIHYPRKFRQPRRPTNESLLDGAELGFGDLIISESIIFTAWISDGRVRVIVNGEQREYEVSAHRHDYLKRLSPTKALKEIEKVTPEYEVIKRH